MSSPKKASLQKILLRILAILLLGLFFYPANLSAQKQIDSQNNAWIWYVGNHQITERWGVYTEYSWRRNELFENWMQSLTRVAAEYYMKQGPVISVGYGFVDTYRYGMQPSAYRFLENRTYQQFSTTQQFGRFYTSNRFRVEQRWIELKSKNDLSEYVRNSSDSFVYRNRIRYRYMVNIPLTRKTMENKTLFLAIADEVFVSAGKEIKLNAFDQNRFYGALGWRIDKDRNIQIGYLNQYIIKSDAKMAERNHTLQIGITWGVDFRKQDSAAMHSPVK